MNCIKSTDRDHSHNSTRTGSRFSRGNAIARILEQLGLLSHRTDANQVTFADSCDCASAACDAISAAKRISDPKRMSD